MVLVGLLLCFVGWVVLLGVVLLGLASCRPLFDAVVALIGWLVMLLVVFGLA